MAIILIFLGLLFLLIATGSWIGTLLGVIGVFIYYVFIGGGELVVAGFICYNTVKSYTLSALPLFIFLASILAASGVGLRLYAGLSRLLSRLPGGLLHANIMASAGFGAVCGSTVATTACISSVAMPYMEREKYPRKLALGSLVSAGGLGLMIPPSSGFIVYGFICNVSVGKLFAAGIFPGILMAILFSSYLAIYCKLTKQPIPVYKAAWKPTALGLISTWPVVVLFLFMMGTIFFGICTPTETAGVGAILAIFVAIIVRKFNIKMVKEAFSSALRISVMIFFIIVGAMVAMASLSNLGIPQDLSNMVVEANLSALTLLLVLSALFIVLGCLMDSLAIMICILPIVFPLVTAVGIDPVWFGVIVIVYIEMAAITPPIGANLFVLQGITGYPIDVIASGVLPFFLLEVLTIVILYIFPEIALFLPNLMF